MADKHEVMDMINESHQAVEALGDRGLGGLVILSALLTEFKLAEVIGAEAKKVKAAAHYVTHHCDSETALSDLKEINDSVQGVLDQVCCLERQVNRKIFQGRRLRGNVLPEETEEE
ncbi:hypothetical protein [Halobacillus salinus]|uniref:Uncharacterized protein n=1 Tax=Halobacillus salinus TaxID=192814 RepID=A0A4Z0GXH5_9BACI|nr:hypothetical protein [Halobacillus salinus]TGB01264.1 hypothetical protein E4663_17470 [Halobacillus salinus]